MEREEWLKKICKHCGFSRGSHNGTAYYSLHYKMHVPLDYCPGHEHGMDWNNGPGTTFKEKETR